MTFAHWISFYTILSRELKRIFRIWQQTFLPPVITQSLYFLVFGSFLGSQIRPIHGIPYIAFLIPGLVMMAVITSSYINVVSSFFGAKFQRSVEELLVSPTPDWIILAGYTMGGVLRASITGCLILLVSFVFVHPSITHPLVVILFGFLTAAVFALGGFLNALYAKNFDDSTMFTTFILTPLTYLGGVFYSINTLPPVFQAISRINPIVYMIDGFRYGFYGINDASPLIGAGMLSLFVACLIGINLYLLRKGTGLRS